MKILIIGGTIFLGKYLTIAALTRGHNLTLFNRGISQSDEWPEVEHIKGDRDKDLDELKGRQWDAVIDTCGYLPYSVSASVEILKDIVSHYTFISTISVYKRFVAMDTLEDSPVRTITEDQVIQSAKFSTGKRATAETYKSFYGGLKAMCEKAVEQTMPENALILRPGLIVGPDDYSGRLGYWIKRIAEGGDVLVPDQPEKRRIRLIDCRDLSDWTIRMIECNTTGVFNTTGTEAYLNHQTFLTECSQICGEKSNFVYATDDFLLQNKVDPWNDLPFWIPLNEKEIDIFGVSNIKAIKNGLTFRSLSATIQDTLTWIETKPDTTEWKYGGLPRNQELKLIKQLKLASNRLIDNFMIIF